MKKSFLSVLTIFLFGTVFTSGQSSFKECNELFDKEVKAKVLDYDRNSFKQFLYKYFMSDVQEKIELKKKAESDFGFGAIVKGVPVDFSTSSGTNNSSDFMRTMKMEVEQRGYVTDDEVNLFVTEFYQEGIFKSYRECIEGKVILNSNGVFATIEGDINSSFIIKMKYKGVKEYITIDKAVFDGANIKYGMTFFDGKKLDDDQTIYQHLQRIPDQPLNITVSFKDKIEGISRTFEAEEMNVSSNKVPIGTIIISVLDYQSFLDVNDDRQRTFDIKKSTWAPCDGRSVTGSKYSSKRTNVPDLRGVFVRGINNMGVPGVLPAKNDQLNPENKVANEFQDMMFQEHHHIQGNYHQGSAPFGTAEIGGSNRRGDTETRADNKRFLTNNAGGNETRPKNRTVYYYIRIN